MSQSFAGALSWVPKSRDLAVTLARAYDYARAQGHGVVTLEHLLLALIADGDASRVLQACNIDSSRLNADASTYLLGLMSHAQVEHAHEPGVDANVIRILDYATAAAQQSRRAEVNGAIVLAAIVGDGGSSAAAMLRAQGLTFEAAIKGLQRATGSGRVAEPPSAASILAPGQPTFSRAAPPTIAPQPVPPAQSNSGSQESAYANSQRQPASADPAAGARASSTEEILAVARQRVEAGRRGFTMPPEQALPGVGQAGSHLQPHVEPWPSQPATQVSSLPDPLVHPQPEAGSKSAAQPIAGPLADEVGASPEARHLEARPAAPRLDWASLPEPSALQPQPVAPMRPSGSPTGPPPLRKTAEAPSPLVLRSSNAAAPPYGEPSPNPPAYASPPAQVETTESVSDPRRDFAFDGNIAGPPYLAPDEAAFSRPRGAAAWRPAPAPAAPLHTSPPTSLFVENIPRKMQVGRPKTVEVRIAKGSARALAGGLQRGGTAYPHDVIITTAMSLRLRAPNGEFWIETSSPETQWIENTLGPLTDEFVSWRWTVAPQRRGRLRLQLIISARTVGADGLATETALQDQMIEVRARPNYGQLSARWAGWVVAAAVGAALARFGGEIWNAGRAALDRLSGV